MARQRMGHVITRELHKNGKPVVPSWLLRVIDLLCQSTVGFFFSYHLTYEVILEVGKFLMSSVLEVGRLDGVFTSHISPRSPLATLKTGTG